jgi:hypothetical protein
MSTVIKKASNEKNLDPEFVKDLEMIMNLDLIEKETSWSVFESGEDSQLLKELESEDFEAEEE